MPFREPGTDAVQPQSHRAELREPADPLATHQPDFGGRTVLHYLNDRDDPGTGEIDRVDPVVRLINDEVVRQLNRTEATRQAPPRLPGKPRQDVVLNIDDFATLTERMKAILWADSLCPM